MRRALLILAVLVAGGAGAEGGENPAFGYIEQGAVLCEERAGERVSECMGVLYSAAARLAMSEAGNPATVDFMVDGDEDGSKLKSIAGECKAATMDGKRVDAITAALCIEQEVARRNWEERRAKRLREEAE